MIRALVAILLLSSVLTACSRTLAPYDAASAPVVSLPLTLAGIEDARGRFREVFCAVLEARRDSVPDYEPCMSALTSVGREPPGTGAPVELGQAGMPVYAGFVPGVGYQCFRDWLEPGDAAANHVRQFGYDGETVVVDALSSSESNARQVRDWVLQAAEAHPDSLIMLIGYSKGTPDVLRALVDFPEIVEHVAVVVSIAGSVGGSPLANDATQRQLELLTHWPDADCEEGDGRGLESMTPGVRQSWLAANELPQAVRYYSIVTFPDPDRISRVLERGYRKLAEIDGRNDSQVIADDQFIPGSTLLAFINADHWAVAVPIARSHSMLGRTFVDHNAYPREALVEAVLRFIEADLSRNP